MMNLRSFIIFVIITFSFFSRAQQDSIPDLSGIKKQLYLSVVVPVNYLNGELYYHESSSYHEKIGSKSNEAKVESRIQQYLVTYPGVQLDYFLGDKIGINLDISYLSLNMITPIFTGTYSSRYCKYGPNYTCTGTVTYDSTYNVQTKIEAQYLNRSIGIGGQLKIKKDMIVFSLNTGRLKPLYIGSTSDYETGKHRADGYNFKFFSLKNFGSDRFLRVKATYIMDLKGKIKFCSGFTYTRKITASSSLEKEPPYSGWSYGHAYDLRNLNLLSAFIGLAYHF